MDTLHWFRLAAADGGITIDFAPGPHQHWDPEVLGRRRLDIPSDASNGVAVRVGGRGSSWMYAAAGAAAAAAAADLAVEAPQIRGRLRAPRGGECAVVEGDWLEQIRPADGARRLILQFRPAGPQSIPESDVVAGQLRAFAAHASRGMQDVVLTGRGPAWGYAVLAAGAVEGGAERVITFSPVDHVPIVCWSRAERGPLSEPPSWLLDALGYGRDAGPGFVVGVIGDPNSGKSVFSMLFERAFAGAGPAFRYDCDRASPTPYWFLRMQAGAADDPTPRELREAVKQKWSPEMERAIAATLERLRTYFAVTIADLPGGNHKITPPARIPPGREVIMREIDRFVLVARDGAAISGWRESLGVHGLADRIVAIVETTDPHGPLALAPHPEHDGQWRVTGLDRGKVLPLLATTASVAAGPWKTLAEQVMGVTDDAT